MKKYFSRFLASVLLVSAVIATNAQGTATPAPRVVANPNEIAIKKANCATAHIESVVKITDEQRTKLRATLLDCIIKFEDARTKANDDTKLAALRTALVEDIKANVKKVLTPEQFETVMKTEFKN